MTKLSNLSTMTIPNFETKVEYPVLTKAAGLLDYMSLKIIKDKLKANASSIDSILGRGMHEHLGLVMNPMEYALDQSFDIHYQLYQ